MSDGFTVNTGALSAGSQQVSELASPIDSAAAEVIEAITGMAGAASGHAGLASALTSTAQRGTETFQVLGTMYRYVGVGLTATAGTYEGNEQALVAAITGTGANQ